MLTRLKLKEVLPVDLPLDLCNYIVYLTTETFYTDIQRITRSVETNRLGIEGINLLIHTAAQLGQTTITVLYHLDALERGLYSSEWICSDFLGLLYRFGVLCRFSYRSTHSQYKMV